MRKTTILFLAANPATTPRMALDLEARAIDDVFSSSGLREMVVLRHRLAVQPSDLLRILNEERPFIVHFAGHGKGGDGLVLQHSEGGETLVSNEALARLFTTLKDDIQLVVLNACNSESQASVIANTVECAIGMRGALDDISARIFAASFYQALGFGRSVKNAFEQAITALAFSGRGGEETPRLVVRDGIEPNRVYPLGVRWEPRTSDQLCLDTIQRSTGKRDITIAIRINDLDQEAICMFGNGVRIGRAAACGFYLPLAPKKIARFHASIHFVQRTGQFIIVDNHSLNGTFVNGIRINRPTILTTGCQIDLGGVLNFEFLRYSDPAAALVYYEPGNKERIRYVLAPCLQITIGNAIDVAARFEIGASRLAQLILKGDSLYGLDFSTQSADCGRGLTPLNLPTKWRCGGICLTLERRL